MTLRVSLVIPERELWSGEARMVIAKTTDGDLGVLSGRAPVFGSLAQGSLVEILPPESGAGDDGKVRAAVSGGFLSVHDDEVSILAAYAELDGEVDAAVAQRELDEAIAEGSRPGEEEPAQVKYARARLRLTEQD